MGGSFSRPRLLRVGRAALVAILSVAMVDLATRFAFRASVVETRVGRATLVARTVVPPAQDVQSAHVVPTRFGTRDGRLHDARS
jgi:hypothetical protein